MLVDNHSFQQPYLSSTSASTFTEYSTDLSDIFDTELYNNAFSAAPSASGSRGSTPHDLLTPPQGPPPTSFPEVHDEESAASTFFSIFEEDLKSMDTLSMPSSSADYLGVDGIDGSYGGGVSSYEMDMSGYGMSMDMSSMGISMTALEDPVQSRGIDPQLVDTPSAISDHGDGESDEKDLPASPIVEKMEPEVPTITIAPVKVGGHGKARKGTVHSGGVVKKTVSSTPTLSVNKEKENSVSATAPQVKKVPPLKFGKPTPATSSIFQSPIPGPFLTSHDNASKAGSDEGDHDDDDDLPQEWRPSPEVLAKMTSKEKRQLRNKISARNFRVRRKGLFRSRIHVS